MGTKSNARVIDVSISKALACFANWRYLFRSLVTSTMTSAMTNDVAAPKVFDPMWQEPPAPFRDGRWIGQGDAIPAEHYADQPYVVETQDGGLLLVITTSAGNEGSRGQHVRSMKSFDGGKTWQDIQPVERAENPESSWAVPLVAPSGRVFVFYVYNADDLRELPADDPPYPGGITHRMDSHGHYVFRWSDDHGKTWSNERGTIPVRDFEIDRLNSTGGKVRLFWNVGKPFVHQGRLYLPVYKVGGFGEGWFMSSECALLCSDDLLTVEDPHEANWSTLPDGDTGIRSPKGGGPIAEEHSFTTLSDGTFFTVFRTIDGHPGCAYSRDEGRSWEPSQYMRFADGRLMKHPRAANFVWKMSDGGYLYFFHNHGGKPLRDRPDRRIFAYTERNPIWFCRGWEIDSLRGKELVWSQPEIGFYDDDPYVRISYPDFLEHGESHFFTETQKSFARIHHLPPALLDSLSADSNRRAARLDDLHPLLFWRRGESRHVTAPELPVFVLRSADPPYGGMRTRLGFSVELELDFETKMEDAGAVLLAESDGDDGRSFRLVWTECCTLRLELNDGQTLVAWESDPVPKAKEQLSFTINVDGASNTITFFRDGMINDGGDERQFGWGRISPHFRNTCTGKAMVLGATVGVSLQRLTIFPHTLTAAEIALRFSKANTTVTKKNGLNPCLDLKTLGPFV